MKGKADLDWTLVELADAVRSGSDLEHTAEGVVALARQNLECDGPFVDVVRKQQDVTADDIASDPRWRDRARPLPDSGSQACSRSR